MRPGSRAEKSLFPRNKGTLGGRESSSWDHEKYCLNSISAKGPWTPLCSGNRSTRYHNLLSKKVKTQSKLKDQYSLQIRFPKNKPGSISQLSLLTSYITLETVISISSLIKIKSSCNLLCLTPQECKNLQTTKQNLF